MEHGKPITCFGLLRHEKTVWNQEKRIQGRKDSPLTSLGRRRAEKWGRRLEAYAWERMIASCAGRAMETALRVNERLQVPLTMDPRLQEQDWGAWTGKTLGQVKAEAPELLKGQEAAGWDFCPPGGEDRKQVWQRSRAALLDAAARWPGRNILVITHIGVVKVLLYGLCRGNFPAAESLVINPRSFHWLIHDGKSLRVKQINAFTLENET
ncbi:MAG: histidine phosphatase family protein [Desulfobacterales bacterium]|nr:histidine phosphatase family protein [Desulfobacterales bacterium]